jgi:hypothetical protein
MTRPRVPHVLGSLAANDVGEEIVTILGRLARSEFDRGQEMPIKIGGSADHSARLGRFPR